MSKKYAMEDSILHEVIAHEKRKAVFEFSQQLINQIHSARSLNLKALISRKYKDNINIFEDPFCCTCNGKILAFDGIEVFIEDLLESYK